MFEKREYRMYKGIKKDKIYKEITDYWSSQGFYVNQISAYYLFGQSYYERIGLRREFYLYLEEKDGDTHINLHFFAKITDTGTIGGLAAAVIALPVAVVGGAISYHEYEKDANSLMYHFWSHLDKITHQPSKIPSQAPKPPSQIKETPSPDKIEKVSTEACAECGALLPPSWKACPYCGKPVKSKKENSIRMG
jgi:hypothetical protein